METEIYWKLMKETSEKINPLIEEAINSSKYISEDPVLFQLPKARIGNPSKLRGYMVRFVYETLEKSEGREPREEEWIPLSAVSELELISMYYLNQVWDGKGGCTTKEDIDRRIIAAGITRNLAFRTLEKRYKGRIEPRKVEELSELLLEADSVFLDGEYIDIFENTYQKSKSLSPEQKFQLCTERTYKMNASFFEKIAQMAGIVSGTEDKEKKEAMKNFGCNLGMVVQIINDLADFVPEKENRGTCEKLPADCYADIKHGKLTYPIIWILHEGTTRHQRLAEDILEGREHRLISLADTTRIIVHGGAMNFTIGKAREYASKAKRDLKIFPSEIRNPLSSTCRMAYNNRLLKSLRNIPNKFLVHYSKIEHLQSGRSIVIESGSNEVFASSAEEAKLFGMPLLLNDNQSAKITYVEEY